MLATAILLFLLHEQIGTMHEKPQPSRNKDRYLLCSSLSSLGQIRYRDPDHNFCIPVGKMHGEILLEGEQFKHDKPLKTKQFSSSDTCFLSPFLFLKKLKRWCSPSFNITSILRKTVPVFCLSVFFVKQLWRVSLSGKKETHLFDGLFFTIV